MSTDSSKRPEYTEGKQIFRCRFCKVPVVSRTNTRAVLGREHGKHCRRRYK